MQKQPMNDRQHAPSRQALPETSLGAPTNMPSRPDRYRRYGRRAAAAALLVATFTVVATLSIDLMISITTGKAVTDDITLVEPRPVALLLGTARTHQGRPNQFYRARIEAAAELFHSGRVRGILVSGDNATRYYNEPVSMQKDLIALGVPPEFITLDYAGFRTLDSVVRAKEVFGVDRLIIVSQRFHAERAIFLARHFGIDAHGLAAADPDRSGLMKVRAREVLARVVAVLDVVIGREPKFLGAPETVRLRDDTRQSNAA